MDTIVHRDTGEVLFEYGGTVKQALEDATARGVYLSHADLEGRSFPTAQLKKIVLIKANMHRVWAPAMDMSDANLLSADLSEAILLTANLHNAFLESTNFENASLQQTDFSLAEMRYANICGANLTNSNLFYANISHVKYSKNTIWPNPSMVLSAFWDNLEDELTQLCMAYEASNHSDPNAFDKWKDGGEIPMNTNTFGKTINFQTKKKLWNSNLKYMRPTAKEVAQALLKSKCLLVN